MTLDLVIRNGLVVDGTGGEPFVSDLAISNGAITAQYITVNADDDSTIDAFAGAASVSAAFGAVGVGVVEL